MMSIAACAESRLPPAPLSDYAALERLATSFREISDLDPQSPSSLSIKQRKTLVERVFKHAGYDYAKTMQALATTHLNSWDRTQRDLVELILFPHRGGQFNEQLASVYSTQELKYIEHLELYLSASSPTR